MGNKIRYPYLMSTYNDNTTSIALIYFNSEELDAFLKLSKFQQGHCQLYCLNPDKSSDFKCSLDTFTCDMVQVFTDSDAIYER